jgi:hypothetical protein
MRGPSVFLDVAMWGYCTTNMITIFLLIFVPKCLKISSSPSFALKSPDEIFMSQIAGKI